MVRREALGADLKTNRKGVVALKKGSFADLEFGEKKISKR
jgi:hypothetical protein